MTRQYDVDQYIGNGLHVAEHHNLWSHVDLYRKKKKKLIVVVDVQTTGFHVLFITHTSSSIGIGITACHHSRCMLCVRARISLLSSCIIPVTVSIRDGVGVWVIGGCER